MTALYIIIGIILLIVVVVLLVPTDFKIESAIIINKPKSDVFSYIKSLKNQDNWSVWNQMDPNMKKTFTGIDSKAGFIAAWDGNKKAGKGEQEIKDIVEGERVDLELRFEKPFKATNNAYLITTAVDPDKTKVVWGFAGTSGRPMNVFSLIMKGMLQKSFNQGLSNLKNILEK